MRKIAVVTGTRAEYGLLSWILRGIRKDPGLKLQLIVTAMHLRREFGSTVRQIEADGMPIAARVPMLTGSDDEQDIARAIGKGIDGFARAYSRLKPDILLVLGDRFEVFAAVAAAVPMRIPIAHIHGGESTEGLIDEVIRHSVTKMSHLHFVSAQAYARRIVQMGEDPKRVFCFGAPGVENVKRMEFLSRAELAGSLGLPLDRPWGIVTYHPVTLEDHTAGRDAEELLKALEREPDIFWVLTLPNADAGGRIIARKMAAFVRSHPSHARVFAALGQHKYFSLMKHAAVMVGNSSSGIIEAPSFRLPVVNIGDRQKGRIRGGNVVDIKVCRAPAICAAVRHALSPRFAGSLKGLENPYGRGDTSRKIIAVLKRTALGEGLLKKRFRETAR